MLSAPKSERNERDDGQKWETTRVPPDDGDQQDEGATKDAAEAKERAKK